MFPAALPVKTTGMSQVLRLLVIPFLVFLIWLAEVWLLCGSQGLFSRGTPAGIFLYTVVACILIGMVIPVLCTRFSFLTGDVNLFQIGFRDLSRTVMACTAVLAIGYFLFILLPPGGMDRKMSAAVFVTLLPTALAAVMVCWAFLGTHLQAYIRRGGMIISISTGVAVTAVLFLAVVFALGVPRPGPDMAGIILCTGIGLAIFFFGVRDVYAAGLMTAFALVYLAGGAVTAATIRENYLYCGLAAVLSFLSLIAVHLYFSRRYTTVLLDQS